MNEFTRVGKGDQYVEICMDWDSDIIPVLWMFREALGEYKFKEARKGIKEVFDLE